MGSDARDEHGLERKGQGRPEHVIELPTRFRRLDFAKDATSTAAFWPREREEPSGRFRTLALETRGEMVLLGRIELPASPLPRVRSTTELQQHGSAPRKAAGVEARANGRRRA